MATEPNIRNLFPTDDTPTKALDAGAIIRRSRARRLPKRLAIGGITTLAVAGIVVASVQGFEASESLSASSQRAEQTSEESVAPQNASGSPSSAELAQGDRTTALGGAMNFDSSKRAPAESINQCEGTLADLDLPSSDLKLSLDFPKIATLDGKEITGTVTLTNTGDETVTGVVRGNQLALTLSRNNTVLWHTNSLIQDTAMHFPEPIEPGESVDYTLSFWPVTCTLKDESPDLEADSGYNEFGEDLPAVAPGDYQLSALMDFQGEHGDVQLLASPSTTITLE